MDKMQVVARPPRKVWRIGLFSCGSPEPDMMRAQIQKSRKRETQELYDNTRAKRRRHSV